MPHSTFLPFSPSTAAADELASVVESMRSGWLSARPKVLRFEERFRERLGVRNAIALNSAAAGLQVALAAAGVGPGDEVVTSALNWPSTVHAIELLGARAVLADLQPDTLLIEPDDVARRISPRTRAIVPLHLAGQPADLDRLRASLAGRPIPILEDAHALGSRYKGRAIGTGSEAAIFGFHPSGETTAGEGGMVTTDDDDLAERMRALRFHGVSRDTQPGRKLDMLDSQASIGIEQLAQLERFQALRKGRAERYTEQLRDLPELRPLGRATYAHEHAWHLFVVRLDLERVSIGRDAFLAQLEQAGIGVGLHFTPAHPQRDPREKYGFRPGDLPVTEVAGEEIFSLPLHPGLTTSDQERILATLREVVRANRVQGRA